MTTGDHYPEIMVGRISGETKEEIATQVNRTLMYEKTPNTTSNWVQNQVGMSSDQGPGDDNQYDYEHICDILDSNKNHYHYVNNKGYFDGDQTGCNDALGSPAPGDLINEFNTGFGLLNYCGHGSTASFTTSGFGISDIPSLQNNTGKWPFIFSTACVNGNFMFQTCLAESLLRAKDNTSGNPQGAIAALMSTINQSWDPPMQGQDEMNAILRGARINNKKSTFGALVANGNMSVMENYNSSSNPQGGDEIADTWTIFGDPSVEVRTKHEGVLTCSHSGWIQQNSTDLYLSCNVDGATIGLYYKGAYWGSKTVFGGVAHLTFDALTDLDSLLITATKQNYVPYLGNAMVVNYPASVQSVENSLNIFIYPNPFNEEIEVSTKDQSMIQSIEIIDMSGKIILTKKTNAASLKINTEAISKGFYIAKITTNKGVVKQKLVK
jgi:gingipain R